MLFDHLTKSRLVAWLVVFLVLLSPITFLSIDLFEIYGNLVSLPMFYMAYGLHFMRKHDIYPAWTERVRNGKTDLKWGLLYMWWSLWWPRYKKKG